MPSDWSPLTFVDVPVLAAVLAEATEFRLLTATELAGSIDLEIWPQISRDEIRYWKPETRLPRQDTKAKTPARHHVKRE
jgi:hypothetical protein